MKKGDKVICIKDYIRTNKYGDILDNFKKNSIYEIADIHGDRIFVIKENNIDFRSFRKRPKFSNYFLIYNT
jgi:hypothetical protein